VVIRALATLPPSLSDPVKPPGCPGPGPLQPPPHASLPPPPPSRSPLPVRLRPWCAFPRRCSGCEQQPRNPTGQELPSLPCTFARKTTFSGYVLTEGNRRICNLRARGEKGKRMRRSWATLVLLLAAGSDGPVLGESPAREEIWEVAHVEGAKIGSVHTTVEPLERSTGRVRATWDLELLFRRHGSLVRLRMEQGTDEEKDGR